MTYSAPAAIFVGEPRHTAPVPAIGEHMRDGDAARAEVVMSETLDHPIISAQWIGRIGRGDRRVTAHLVMGFRATLFQDVGEPRDGDAVPFTVHRCLASRCVRCRRSGRTVIRRAAASCRRCRCRGGCGPVASWNCSTRCGSAMNQRTVADLGCHAEDWSTGTLCFVAVEHIVPTPRGTAIRERQDIVYREMGGRRPPRQGAASPAGGEASREPHGRSGAAVPLFGADLQRRIASITTATMSRRSRAIRG